VPDSVPVAVYQIFSVSVRTLGLVNTIRQAAEDARQFKTVLVFKGGVVHFDCDFDFHFKTPLV
jgi:hypothetical protein